MHVLLYLSYVTLHFSVSYNSLLLQRFRLLMQAFLRRFFCLPKKPTTPNRPFSTSYRMSSSGIAASLYAATISPASVTGAEPEEAKDKRHHLKDGKGFTNPWVRAEPPITGHENYTDWHDLPYRIAGLKCLVLKSQRRWQCTFSRQW